MNINTNENTKLINAILNVLSDGLIYTCKEVSEEINCSTQKTCALLKTLEYNNMVHRIPLVTNGTHIHAYSIYDNAIKIDWELADNSINFETTSSSPSSYKEKILSLIYEILLDLFI